MEKNLNISVFLAERKYTVSVKPEEEPYVREASEYINKQLKEMSVKFAFKDRQDIVSMVALINTIKMLEHETNHKFFSSEFLVRLNELQLTIDKELQ